MNRSLFAAAAVAVLFCSPGAAQTAVDRAGELKAWREQCSDPDSDLRLAYIEAALETNDTAVMRICIRQSLESDNSDIRNLGLRAALASIDQIAFSVQPPAMLVDALAEAGDNEDRLDDISRWYIARDWQQLQNGLVFAVSKADFVGGTGTWSPLVRLSKASDRYVGKFTILGDKVTWVGSAYLETNECSLNATLVPGPALEGEWLCARGEPFKVTADLL